MDLITYALCKKGSSIPLRGKEQFDVITNGTLVYAEHLVHNDIDPDSPFTINGYSLTTNEYEDGTTLLISVVGVEDGEVTVGTQLSYDTDGVLFLVLDDDGLDGKEYILASGKTTIYPDNVLNLYDPNDPHGDETFYPDYVVYNESLDCYTLSEDYDASAFYKAISDGKCGMVCVNNVRYTIAQYSFEEVGEGIALAIYTGASNGDLGFYILNYGQFAPAADESDDNTDNNLPDINPIDLGGGNDPLPSPNEPDVVATTKKKTRKE